LFAIAIPLSRRRERGASQKATMRYGIHAIATSSRPIQCRGWIGARLTMAAVKVLSIFGLGETIRDGATMRLF
jgi:hypothetical protein